jgi:hypothetical protein
MTRVRCGHERLTNGADGTSALPQITAVFGLQGPFMVLSVMACNHKAFPLIEFDRNNRASNAPSLCVAVYKIDDEKSRATR